MLKPPRHDPSIRPVFVIGAPRSGTSALNWALGQLPNVQPMEETGWISALAVGGFVAHLQGTARGRRSHLSNAHYEARYLLQHLGESAHAIVMDCFRERCAMLDQLDRDDPQRERTPFRLRLDPGDPKQRWIDSTPNNTFFVWALDKMFPEAMFVHCLRRPDHVASSLEGFDALGQPAVELEQGLRIWLEHTRAALAGEKALGAGKVFRLDFARLEAEPEALMRDVCSFLGEDFHAECLVPLGRRINSSGVADRRAADFERMRGLPAFEQCERLHREALERSPPGARDEATASELRAEFVRYCERRASP